ncbi:putative steryl acetyl hydrolase mug81, partial [Elasticomyces elasticus]
MVTVPETTESQWLAQLTAMRAAIAELKLPQINGTTQEYGKDIILDDDDEDFSATSSGEDIWDLISDAEADE